MPIPPIFAIIISATGIVLFALLVGLSKRKNNANAFHGSLYSRHTVWVDASQAANTTAHPSMQQPMQRAATRGLEAIDPAGALDEAVQTASVEFFPVSTAPEIPALVAPELAERPPTVNEAIAIPPVAEDETPATVDDLSSADWASEAREAIQSLETAFAYLTHDVAAPLISTNGHRRTENAGVSAFYATDRDVVNPALFPAEELIPMNADEPSKASEAARLDDSQPCAEPEPLQSTEFSQPTPEPAVVVRPAPPTFLTFYGLTQQPFDVSPDPAYLYLGPAHSEALESLSLGIENLRGFMALIAKPGMGKTTLLNKLMEEFRDRARVVLLFQSQCNSTELLCYLLSELGMAYNPANVVSMHRALNDLLLQEMLQGRRFVLIVDEAQNLDSSVLETVRLLSDFETTNSKLIQIILAGQPQLIQTLMKPNLSQLRQRIAMVAHLEPLDAHQVTEYVEHRLRIAGSDGRSIFSPEALTAIAERSEGIPRVINNFCFNAMVSGYAKQQSIVGVEIVQAVANKLSLDPVLWSSQPDPASINSLFQP